MEFLLFLFGSMIIGGLLMFGYAVDSELSMINNSLTEIRITLGDIREALNRIADSHEKISKRY